MNKLYIKVALQIGKPVSEVFEAIVNPDHMCGYFISYSSGRMISEGELIWRFPEFEGDSSIRVGNVIRDKSIIFYWEINGKELKVEISLTQVSSDTTLVVIKESEMEVNEEGINWLKGNTEGWANFLCCLKAYLEYGVNLRKGGFDFLIKTT